MQALAVGDVARERLLVGDRDPLGRGLERRAGRSRARGRAACARPCRGRAQVVVAERGEAADRLDPGRPQPLLGARADPRQHPQRQRREERRLASRPDDGQPAGLAAVGRDLRDDLRRRDARASTRAACARARPPAPPRRARARRRTPARPRRDRGSPRRSRPARPSARRRARSTTPRASSRGRGHARARRTPPAGSAAAPRRTTSPSRCRSARAT